MDGDKVQATYHDGTYDPLPGSTPVPEKTLDRAKLLAHLATKAGHKNLLIHSVVSGLITAVKRGDFDTTEEARR
ncbi:hypothetical protein EDF38_1290 [Frigoribacterium sp. PhB160]|uniref:hypothetical protein n=1 Tax=Frigoribacterium sp. PhB160 TaxID=2485192 RepID=UPI000F46AAFD|nr:hypothetical protein [Frigoribacterium sp. PhB160]ROS62187.1 hypothetical protein EDF38_1290 [Frigoribacterium sp. PhB160]